MRMTYLHFTFLPRINKCLHDFQESWNNHGLSAEGNRTPYQLFVEGFVHEETTPAIPPNSTYSAHSSATDSTQGPDAVAVPTNKFRLCSVLQEELSSSDPLQPCADHGRSIYINVISMLGSHVCQCQNCFVEY